MDRSLETTGIGVVREPFLHVVDVFGSSLVNRPGAVEADYVLDAACHQYLGAGYSSSADTGYDDFELTHLFAHYFQGVDQGRQDDHRRAVLIVVKDRNVQLSL